MLSTKYNDYLENEMGLCPLSIQNKISQLPIDEDNVKIYTVIQHFINLINNDKYLTIIEKQQAIDNCFSNNFNNNADKSYQIVDAIRHACILFVVGGVENIYKNQENEDWYPEIRLNKLPLNFDELKNHKNVDQNSDLLTIYRGCNHSEYISGEFRHAWTTDKSIAEGFAFKHFNTSMANIEDERVVLKTTYTKEYIVHVPANSCECEVVIDPKKITTCPEIVQKKTIL